MYIYIYIYISIYASNPLDSVVAAWLLDVNKSCCRMFGVSVSNTHDLKITTQVLLMEGYV